MYPLRRIGYGGGLKKLKSFSGSAESRITDGLDGLMRYSSGKSTKKEIIEALNLTC
jgi:hypothetical protein